MNNRETWASSEVVPYLELEAVSHTKVPDRPLLQLLPAHYASVYRTIPLHFDGQRLVVAIVPPHLPHVLARLSEVAGCPVVAAPVAAETFQRLHDALYRPLHARSQAPPPAPPPSLAQQLSQAWFGWALTGFALLLILGGRWLAPAHLIFLGSACLLLALLFLKHQGES